MIDPLEQKCNCGYRFHIPAWTKLCMLLFGDYNYHCPQCGAVLTFRLVYHTVKISTNETIEKEIWRNG